MRKNLLDSIPVCGNAQRRLVKKFSLETLSTVLATYRKTERDKIMGLGTILLVILVLALLGVIPAWPHSREWGYGPSGGLGLVVVILLILLLLGKI